MNTELVFIIFLKAGPNLMWKTLLNFNWNLNLKLNIISGIFRKVFTYWMVLLARSSSLVVFVWSQLWFVIFLTCWLLRVFRFDLVFSLIGLIFCFLGFLFKSLLLQIFSYLQFLCIQSVLIWFYSHVLSLYQIGSLSVSVLSGFQILCGYSWCFILFV